jgi:hypothetical protein
MADGKPDRPGAPASAPLSPTPGYWDHYENVYRDRPEGYDGTCLRPLGRCQMGGCCDLCWHNPDHPRFAARKPTSG